MSTTQQLVVGVFRDRTQAEQAIHELLQTGFGHHQIRFAGRGSSTGGILEKIKSVFTGQDISAGGIYDDLVNMGAPPEDARYYQSEFEAGRSIVAVMGTGNMQEAVNILARHGGYGTNQRFGQSANYGRVAGVQESANYGASAGTQESTTEGEQRVKLREEELRARKQVVETGEARVHKDVVTEEKSIDVPVTREEVYIEHRPGSGVPSDQPISEGETYRIPLREEQVTTEKIPVEHEEVAFGKRPVQETQRVTETVQREEAYVEPVGEAHAQERGVEQERDVEKEGDVKQKRDIRRGRGRKDASDQTMP